MAQSARQGQFNRGQAVQTPKPVSVAKPTNTAADMTCSLCLDHLMEPKLLPCLHSFCKACLEGLVRKTKTKGKAACPQCRCVHSVPKDGVDGFPADLVATHTLAFTKDFQEPIAQSTKPLSCNMCTEGDPATNHCPACSRFLCEFCTKNHRRQVDYHTHKLVRVDEADTEALKAFERPQYCTHHQGEVLKLYCTTCHQLICRDCTIVAHRDHSFGFNSSLRPKVEKEIREMVKGIAAKQKEFEAHLEFINTAEKGRSDRSANLTREINTAFDTFIRLVEQQRQNLLRQEENAKTADLKRIWGQKQFIEITLASFASGLSYVDRLCGCTNDQDMLAMSHSVKQQLSALHRKTWSPESSFQCSNLFTFIGQANGQQVAKSIGSLNSVHSSQFSVSLNPLTPRPPQGTFEINLDLRKSVQFEVKIMNLPTLVHLVTPSVSVTDCDSGGSLDYVHTLVYDQKRKFWRLTVTPTYPGYFQVSAFVAPQQGSGVAQACTHDQGYGGMRVAGPDYVQYGGYGMYQGSGVGLTDTRGQYHGSSVAGAVYDEYNQPVMSNVYAISVTGELKPGDRVRRGLDWQGGDEDGGEGSEGVVIEPDSKAQPKQENDPYGHRASRSICPEVIVSVHWTNGNTAQYSWFGQGESFPIIELVPKYLQ